VRSHEERLIPSAGPVDHPRVRLRPWRVGQQGRRSPFAVRRSPDKIPGPIIVIMSINVSSSENCPPRQFRVAVANFWFQAAAGLRDEFEAARNSIEGEPIAPEGLKGVTCGKLARQTDVVADIEQCLARAFRRRRWPPARWPASRSAPGRPDCPRRRVRRKGLPGIARCRRIRILPSELRDRSPPSNRRRRQAAHRHALRIRSALCAPRRGCATLERALRGAPGHPICSW